MLELQPQDTDVLSERVDELARQYTKQSTQPITIRESNSEEGKVDIIVGLERDPVKLCDLCYEEAKEVDFYSLMCQHSFCKLCHVDFLESSINDGKVVNIACMQGGCNREY